MIPLVTADEPDIWSQSDIEAADAAAGWKRDIEPFAGQAKLVSPAVSNTYSSDATPSRWMDWWLGNCSSCSVDAIAMHWYGKAADADGFEAHFDQAIARWGKPVSTLAPAPHAHPGPCEL